MVGPGIILIILKLLSGISVCSRLNGCQRSLKGLVKYHGEAPCSLSSILEFEIAKVAMQLNGHRGFGGVSETDISQNRKCHLLNMSRLHSKSRSKSVCGRRASQELTLIQVRAKPTLRLPTEMLGTAAKDGTRYRAGAAAVGAILAWKKSIQPVVD